MARKYRRQQAGLGTEHFESHRQVRRHRRFTDAAFSRRDQHDILDRRQKVGLPRTGLTPAHLCAEVDLQAGDAGDRAQCLLAVGLNGFAQRTGRRSSSTRKRTRPLSMPRSLTIPRLTMSRCNSGSWTLRSASIIVSCEIFSTRFLSMRMNYRLIRSTMSII